MLNRLLLATLCAVPGGSGETLAVPLSPDARPIDSGCDVLFAYSLDGRVLVDGKEYFITPPPLEEGKRVGYGLVYFTGQPEGSIPRQNLFLVAGYDTDHAKLFVDANNNLDFTDDEASLVEEQDGSFLVRLHAAGKPDHQFLVRLRSYRDRQEEAEVFGSALGDYIKRMGGIPTKPKHWFSEQRLSTVTADVKLGDMSFRIGVIDYDCNGSYSDRGKDRILLGYPGEVAPSTRLSGGATTLEEETLILVQGHVFEVVEVDSAGRSLKIEASEKPYTRLSPGMRIPSLRLELLSGKGSDLSSYSKPGRYLLIDFWGEWCAGCMAAIPSVKELQSKWKDKLTILGLHNGNPDAAREIVEKKGMAWDQAKSTEDIQRRFLVDSYPFYVLVGPDGRILEINPRLSRVEAILQAASR